MKIPKAFLPTNSKEKYKYLYTLIVGRKAYSENYFITIYPGITMSYSLPGFPASRNTTGQKQSFSRMHGKTDFISRNSAGILPAYRQGQDISQNRCGQACGIRIDQEKQGIIRQYFQTFLYQREKLIFNFPDLAPGSRP